MKTAKIEKIVEGGIRILSEFLPQKTYLYFPLLNAAFVWAVRRVDQWKEKILSWKVWLDPHRIETKSDEFILHFFESVPSLREIYKEDIHKKNWKILRDAFDRLYPILGLEDPFLSALFYKELEEKKYTEIVKEFDRKVTQAEMDIEAVEDSSGLLQGLKAFADEISSLGLELVPQDKVQKAIVDLIKRSLRQKNE